MEELMDNKKHVKTVLKGVSIMALATGVGVLANGCQTSGSCGAGSCGDKHQENAEKSSCGKGSCGKGSCS